VRPLNVSVCRVFCGSSSCGACLVKFARSSTSEWAVWWQQQQQQQQLHAGVACSCCWSGWLTPPPPSPPSPIRPHRRRRLRRRRRQRRCQELLSPRPRSPRHVIGLQQIWGHVWWTVWGVAAWTAFVDCTCGPGVHWQSSSCVCKGASFHLSSSRSP